MSNRGLLLNGSKGNLKTIEWLILKIVRITISNFSGSLCNDLMWCIFPFLEVNGHDPELYEFSLSHYYSELKNVLETFGCSLTTFGLPESLAEFRSLVRRGFVLEFLIVTTLRPVLNITRWRIRKQSPAIWTTPVLCCSAHYTSQHIYPMYFVAFLENSLVRSEKSATQTFSTLSCAELKPWECTMN